MFLVLFSNQIGKVWILFGKYYPNTWKGMKSIWLMQRRIKSCPYIWLFLERPFASSGIAETITSNAVFRTNINFRFRLNYTWRLLRLRRMLKNWTTTLIHVPLIIDSLCFKHKADHKQSGSSWMWGRRLFFISY